ncbi:MAG: hypothetical protein F6K26_00490 [Moorea sp. SIO2I5]|nr:hypothetical protein [Moorena sp. SIO2I5]
MKPLMILANKIAYWTVPPGIKKVILSHLSKRIESWNFYTIPREHQLLLQKNQVLHNRHAGERCFILATGPSIKSQNLKLLQGENCIAVSNFFLHPDYSLIRPRYYCIAPYHLPLTEESWSGWMKELDHGTGDSTFFFSLRDQKRVEVTGHFANRQLHYLWFGASSEMILNSGIDLTRPILPIHTVTIMALQVAIYMGFRQIYLLGCDHNQIIGLNKSKYFFSTEEFVQVTKRPLEWNERDIEWFCQEYVDQWGNYKLMRRLADANSIQILNATPNSLLDVFPRVKYESLFNGN